jgi:RAP domain
LPFRLFSPSIKPALTYPPTKIQCFFLSIIAVDLCIPEERIAIEVDGPHHFTRNSLRPMADMFTRTFLLESRGYKVISVPFFAWEGVEEPARRSFLLNLLARARAGDAQHPTKDDQGKGRRGPGGNKAGEGDEPEELQQQEEIEKPAGREGVVIPMQMPQAAAGKEQQ